MRHMWTALLSTLAFALLAIGNGASEDGDDLLARAANLPGLTSYSVPAHFTVHLHKPIGIRTHVDGLAYFKAPGSAALAITKAPPVIGGFFKGTYQLDVVPQAWTAKYHVTSTESGGGANGAVTLLHAVPDEPGDVTGVVFGISAAGAPVSALWTYKDGSTIALTFTNAPAGAYVLPATATIAVAVPSYRLEASVTYGTYAINAPVSDSVFQTK